MQLKTKQNETYPHYKMQNDENYTFPHSIKKKKRNISDNLYLHLLQLLLSVELADYSVFQRRETVFFPPGLNNS